MNKVVLASAKRTPTDSFQGELSFITASQLGKIIIEKVIAESQIAFEITGLDGFSEIVNRGAVSLVQPIGARFLTTQINEIKRMKSELGLASQCISGGEASALIIKNYIG